MPADRSGRDISMMVTMQIKSANYKLSFERSTNDGKFISHIHTWIQALIIVIAAKAIVRMHTEASYLCQWR